MRAEFFDHALHVGAGRVVRDLQLFADAGRAQACGEQPQHFALADRQPQDRHERLHCGLSPLARRQRDAADVAENRHERLGGLILPHDSVAARRQRRFLRIGISPLGQEHDRDVGQG